MVLASGRAMHQRSARTDLVFAGSRRAALDSADVSLHELTAQDSTLWLLPSAMLLALGGALTRRLRALHLRRTSHRSQLRCSCTNVRAWASGVSGKCRRQVRSPPASDAIVYPGRELPPSTLPATKQVKSLWAGFLVSPAGRAASRVTVKPRLCEPLRVLCF